MNTEKNKIILDSLAEAVVTVDKNFKITFINEAAENITGYKKEKIIGAYCKHFFHSEFCEFNCPIVSVLKNGKNVYDRETEIHCNGKGTIPIKLNAAVLKDERNKPAGGVISFRDISILKEYDKILKNDSHYHGIIGKSKKLKNIFNLVDEMSDSDAPVLITGETGTGKELIADAIQRLSKRKDKPYLKINCSVFPNELLASELFGHVKGAFTHAERDRIGRFELANTGTIFLDEIAEMPLRMQTNLLRILQDGSFERIGDSKPRFADVRIIAATNKNLEDQIKNNLFREDLYFRINVIPVTLPSLRERVDDIPLLVNYFIKKLSKLYNKHIENIDNEALKMLMEYDWPGNIRQLENAIEYAFVRSRKNIGICKCCLPEYLRVNVDCKKENYPIIHRDYLSPERLLKLLDENNWNKTKVAKILGVNRTTIWRHLKKYGLPNNN